MSFSQFNLDQNIISSLEKAKITELSNIQVQSFSEITAGQNVWLKSPTGTGKTLAYILPLINKIIEEKKPLTQVVFLTPTHELAVQISAFINETFSSVGFKSLALIGKASIERQKEKLKKKPQLVVGSVGRILELIEQKKLKANHLKYCIIDEADRMLDDESFTIIKKILEKTNNVQYILGSATIRNNAFQMAETFVDNLKLIDNNTEQSTIIHSYLEVDNNRKNDAIRSLLNAISPAKSIVFLHRNDDVDFVTKKLAQKDINVVSIHGAQDKVQRASTLKKFKNGQISVLIASDVAARGLDVNDINFVINYDIPNKIEDYLHRAGRTGRMGKSGNSVLIASGYEMSIVAKLEKKLARDIKQAKLSHGEFIVPN